MRTIKFRGLTEDKKWVYGYYWTTKHKWFALIRDEQTGEDFEVDPKTVGQFTGMTDKNGKLIFEGDRIKNFQADDNEVYWHEDGSWCMCNYHAGALLLSDYASVSEVIGNIHEETEK